MAIKPVEWPALSDWRAVLTRSWTEAGDDNVGLLAAGVAFYAFLAFVPLLASAVLAYGLAADPATVAAHIQELARALPREMAAIIADQLKGMTEGKDAAKGLGLVVALGLAVYGASKGAGAIVTALNIAYEVRETRGFVRRTALAMLMAVGATLVLLLAALAISALGHVEALLPGAPSFIHTGLRILFWTAAAVGVSLGLALVYRYAPNRPDAPWRWITPGSALATLVWLLASLGFGLYVANLGNYNATYGSLGGVVVFLTWLYLSAYIVLMGAELNSELERQQAGSLPGPAKEGDQVGALAGVGDAGEVHRSVRGDRFGIGDEAVEQRSVPAALAAGEGAQGGRIVEAGRRGDSAPDDSVEAGAGKVVLARFQRMAGIAFLVGAFATLGVGLRRGRRKAGQNYYRTPQQDGVSHRAPV